MTLEALHIPRDNRFRLKHLKSQLEIIGAVRLTLAPTLEREAHRISGAECVQRVVQQGAVQIQASSVWTHAGRVDPCGSVTRAGPTDARDAALRISSQPDQRRIVVAQSSFDLRWFNAVMTPHVLIAMQSRDQAR